MTTSSTRRRQRASGTVVEYPDTDGKPMAETPLHRDEMYRVIYTLQDAFAGRPEVYVSGNMMLYYRQGDPSATVSPDVQVTFGVLKLPERRVYLTWVEGAPPTVVFEITSRSTRADDERRKRDLYVAMGVAEYYLYDPLGEYLRPALQGNLLVDGSYQPMTPGTDGSLLSDALGMRLALVNGWLRFWDRDTGVELLSPSERVEAETARANAAVAQADAANAQARVATAQAEAAAAARRAAEQRIAELERRLREQQSP